MAQPTPYDRQANFTNEESLNPTGKTPGTSLDAEFNSVKVSLDQTQANLALIQRDDGALRNGIVTQDSFAPSLSIGFTLQGPWTAPFNYVAGDGVTYDSAFYRALSSHTAAVSSPPSVATTLWEKLADFTDLAPAFIPDGSVTTAKLASGAATADKLGTGAVTDAKLWANPIGAGAVGDGSTDDTAAFATLESRASGAAIDLRGRVYAVAAEPEGAQYFNGAFKVGSTIYTRPRQPLAHPLDGQVTVSPVATGGLQHPWVGPQGVFSDDRKVRATLPDATKHEVDVGGRVLMESSFSGGASWLSPVTVYQSDTYEARGLVGGMTASGTRFVMAWLDQDSTGASGEVKFAYSTDGVTVSPASGAPGTVASGGNVFYPHGDIVEDASGNIYFFGVRGSVDLVAAKGVWGGSSYTWTVSTIATIGTGTIAEPVALLTASGWVFLIRNDAGGNAYGLKCNLDFSGPSAFSDSGVPLGANPAAGVKAWGRGHVYLTARRSTPILGYQNALLHADVDLEALWLAGGVWPSSVAWAPVARLDDFGLGYLTICKLRGGYWEGLCGEYETLVGTAVASTSRLVRLGGLPVATSVPASVSARRSRAPLNYNPGLQHWTRATSITCSTGVATKTADGLIVTGPGANVTVAREAVAEALRDRLPHRPYYCARVTSASGGSGRLFERRIYGREQIELLARQVLRVNAQFAGDIPGYFRLTVSINFGSGGSSTVSSFADSAQNTDGTDDFLWISEFVSAPGIDGKTFGTLPYLSVSLLSNSAGALDARLFGLWADSGPEQVPLTPANLDEDRLLIDRYIRRWDFAADGMVAVTSRVSDNVGVACLQLAPLMVRDPAITLPSGTTAASFYVNSAANTLTDFSFDGLGTGAFRLRTERTGAFTATAQEIRSVGAATVLFDAEPTA